MYKTGALILHSSKVLLPALAAASRLVSGVLYVPLAYQPVAAAGTRNGKSESDGTRREVWNLSEQIKRIYFHASQQCPLLDVRVLLPPPTSPLDQLKSVAILEHGNLDVLLSSVPSLEEVKRSPGYLLLAERIQSNRKTIFKEITCDSRESDSNETKKATPTSGDYDTFITFSAVALGGTFDNIHNGHRLLLAQSALLAQRRVVVGVSSGSLLANKVLTELIKPIEVRQAEVEAFLRDVKPWLELEVVPITDVFGPTAWDGDLEGLVVSHETARGGDLINQEREKKGLRPLAVHVIDLIDRSQDSSLAQEQKLSSSDIRRSMLGSYREAQDNCCLKSHDPHAGPYLIGLTGGIATGKSSILKRLVAMGAYPIDCDKLGHEACEPHTLAFSKLVEEFGEKILDEEGKINRRLLGPIVFTDKNKLERVNEIVWPEIWRLAEEKISLCHSEGYGVCVVDAAVLVKAGWHRNLHEIWATIAPEKEAVRRIMERDQLAEEAAKRRMAAQLTNAEYVRHANVIFSTQWEAEYTQKQVEKSWRALLERISAKTMPSKI